MCTKMTERDFELARKVFRACLPRVGAKANNDRLFLEALHYFTLHNISWRALKDAVRPLEQRLETLRPSGRGRCV